MRGPRSWWRFWVELFGQRERGSTLAAVRIGLGMALLYSLLSPAAFGLVDQLFVHADHGGIRPIGGSWLMRLMGGATPTNVWILWSTSLLLTLCLVAGVGGRLVPLLLLQTYGGIFTANFYASGGYDYLFTNALWLMALGNANRTWSLDCRRRTGAWSSQELVSAWPRYLLIFQLVVLYTSTGFRKSSVVWLPTDGYSALYYALMDPTWTRYDYTAVAWVYPLTQIGAAITVHWEQSTIFLLLVFYFRYTKDRPGRMRRWSNRWDLRKPWLLIGIGLHVSILLALNVGPFSWVSLAYYPCLFGPHELEPAVAGTGRRLRTAVGRIWPPARRLATSPGRSSQP
jgi:hypothetical protein